jgi:pheromone shutdown protein TraB
MSSMLLKSAREYSSVVAVVGKGHVSGIKKNWQQPIQVSFFFQTKKPLICMSYILHHLGIGNGSLVL